MKYILYILLGFFLYRFVVGFLVPVIRTGSRIRKQFREMQSKMQEQMDQTNPQGTHTQPENPQKKSVVGEYIDFEEVK